MYTGESEMHRIQEAERIKKQMKLNYFELSAFCRFPFEKREKKDNKTLEHLMETDGHFEIETT